MAKRREPVSTGETDFIAEVEFVGVPGCKLLAEERTRIVHELLKQWTLRAHTRGRPRLNEGDIDR